MKKKNIKKEKERYLVEYRFIYRDYLNTYKTLDIIEATPKKSASKSAKWTFVLSRFDVKLVTKDQNQLS